MASTKKSGILDANTVMYGSFGYIIHEGKWMTNITQFQGNPQINKEEIKRCGTRWVGHKATSILGTGSMTGFKMTPTFAKKIAKFADDKSPMFVTELIGKLNDPDAPNSKQSVRYKGVQFDVIPLIQYEAGAIVTEEIPFTYSGIEFID